MDVSIISFVKARMITFYMRLINGKDTKLSFIMYRVLRKKNCLDVHFESKWIDMVKTVLVENDMGDIWFQKGMGLTTDQVKKRVKYKIKEAFSQKWKNDVMNHEYCNIYSTFKLDWSYEKY